MNISGTETDPVWSVDKPSYSTKAVADTLYKPAGYTPDLSAYSTKSVADTLYLGINSVATNSSSLEGHSASYFQTALGYTPYNATNPNGYITGITSLNVTTALGYTPYSSANPNGYITGINSSAVTTALGYTPYNSSNPNGYISSYTETDPTIYAWAKAATKPTYVWTDIGSRPTLLSQFTNDLGNYGGFVTGTPWTSMGYLTSYTETDPTISAWAKAATKPTYTASEVGAPAGSGTSTGTNTGDETTSSIKTKLGAASTSTDGYLTSTDWNTFNNKQPAGSYLTSITSGNVTTALGYTPYNATNPAGYISSYTETDPTIYAWAKAATKPTYSYGEISSTPTLLSQFTNDLGNYGGFVTGTPWTSMGYVTGTPWTAMGYLTSYTETDPTISAWAKAGVKPSYVWTEIGSRPTLLSQFTNDLGNYGGFLTSYTETDPTIYAWAKAATKPTYTASEVGAPSGSGTSTGTNTGDQNISGLVPYTGASSDVNLGTHTLTTNGITTTGNIAITGSIIPSANDTYDLGSPTNMWRNLYVGAHSIYVNGQEVLQTDPSQNVVVSADLNQNLNIKTSGTGNIELNPSGVGQILLKGSLLISAGKNITTSDSLPLSIPFGVTTLSNISANGTITASNISGSTSGTNTGDETQSSIQIKLGVASGSASGYLTSTDWNIFNNKQPAGSYLTSYTETDPTISAWAKAATKPTYTASEVGLGNVTNESKATMFTSPTFTGTVSGITAAMVGAPSGSGTSTGTNTGDNAVNSLYSGLATSKQDVLNGTGFVKSTAGTISYDNSTYEPAFTKNTAFNKNFGTTSGTVLEGRIFGTAANSAITDFAPASGSGNYIQNQSGAAQSANGWISGWFQANGGLIGNTLQSTVATGTAPLTVASTTVVNNLNADMLDGQHSNSFAGLHAGVTDLNGIGLSNPYTFFYSTIDATNRPAGASYMQGIQFPVDNNLGYRDILASSYQGELYYRRSRGDVWGSWYKIWTEANLTNPTTGTGTSGYLPKWTGTGTLGNSPIYTDGTNAIIGTGFTTTQVSPDGIEGNFITFRGTPDGIGYNHAKIYSSRDYNSTSYGSYLAFYTENKNSGTTDTTTEKMRITSLGNVGIGTTSPGYPLDVLGSGVRIRSAAVQNNILVLDSGSGTGSGAISTLSFNTGGVAQGYIQSQQNNKLLEFGTSNLTRMAIDASGNVGVGNINPLDKLHVSGNLRFDSDPTIKWSSNYLYLQTQTASIPVITFLNSASGNYAPRIDMKNNTGASTIISIDAGGNSYINSGNVGIGTTSPTRKLDILDNSSIDQFGVYSNNATPAIRSYSTSNGSGLLFNSYYAVAPNRGVPGAVYSDIVASSENPNYSSLMRFFTRNSLGSPIEAMRIDGNSNVGIGTTTPGTTKLFVQGDGGTGDMIDLYNPSTINGVKLKLADNINNYTFQTIPYAEGSDLAIKYANGGSEYLRINGTTGSVGIGTANPGAKLVVQGTGAEFRVGNDATNVVAVGGFDSTWNYIKSINLGTAFLPLQFQASQYALMNGNVGIGTTGPGYSLDVNGQGRFVSNSSSLGVIISNGTSSYNGLGLDTATGLKTVLNIPNTTGSQFVFTKGYTGGAPLNPLVTILGDTGNVGIGTTNPGSPLELAKTTTWGTMNNPIININNSGTGGDISQPHNMGSITWVSGNVPTAAISAIRNTPGSGNNVELRFTTASAGAQYERMIITNNGNVGIGTTAPLSKLSVSDDIYTAIQLESKYNYVENRNWAFKLNNFGPGNWGGFGIFQSTGQQTDAFSGVARFGIDQNGNVGIGTQTPGAKLDVIGNIYLSSANPYGGSSVYNVQKEQNVSSASVAGAGWYRVAQLGDVRGQNTVTIYTTGGSYAPQSTTIRWWHDWSAQGGLNVISEFGSSFWSQARVTSDGITNSYLEVYFNQAMAGGVYLSMQYDGGFAKGSLYSGSLPVGGDTVRMTTTTGLLSVGDKLTINNSGNVGIGITSPSQKLDVNGILKIEGQASSTFNSTSQGISFFAGNDNYKIGFDSQAGSRGYIRYNVDTNDSVHGHIFSAGASGSQTDLMTILGNGNVGIGTANPGTKLDIQGAINTSPVSIAQSGAANNTFGDYIGLDFKMSNEMSQYTGNPAARISAYLEGGSNGYGLDFWTKPDAANFSKAMRINRYGNVGIGTTSPDYKLTVNSSGNTSSAASALHGQYYGPMISTGQTSSSYYALNITNNASGPGTGNSIFYVRADGNIGIGTTNPRASLEIAGGIRVADGVYGVSNSAGNQILASSSGSNYLYSRTSGNLIIRNGADSAELLRITDSGNVGIGTTSPNQKLEVSGTIRQTGCTTAGTISVNASGDIICTPSSIRFKNTKEDLEVALQTLTGLNPVSYKFNDNMNLGSDVHFGFISEEVNAVNPALATHDASGAPYGIDTNAILAVTVNAVKELNNKIEEMNLKISDLSSLDTTKATSLGSLMKTFLADEYNRVEKIFAKTVVTEGLEMKDSATGETYCVMVTNGEINKVKGKCGEPIVAPASQVAAPVVSTLPAPSCTDGIMNQDEMGIDTGGICDVPILVDVTAYDNALAAKVEADYTTDSWADYKNILDANKVTNTNTQAEVDTATANIITAQGSLIPN